MYDYIIKTLDERTLYFFENGGICVKDLSSKSNKYKVIYEDGVKDFAVEDLGVGKVGIVCQNKEGSIVFIKEDGENYIKTTLLNNKSQVYYDKYFKLKLHGNWLGLSYIIEYNNNNILCFQLVDNENEPPLAVDYVINKTYFSFVNESFDRIFFYNKENEFGYKNYRWSKKDFTEYEKIDEGQIVHIINDFSDNFYIVYLKNNKYFLKILKQNDDGFIYEDYPLDFIDLFDEIVMMIENKNLWIVVKRYNFTFGRKTDINEISFSPQYNFFCDGEIRSFPLSVRDKEKKAEFLFGTLENGRPELILYKDLYNFKNSVKVMGREIKKEDTPFYKMGIEINKLSIRLSNLEKKVSEYLGKGKIE